MTTETRTFVGEMSTGIGDGYAGFRIGQTYTGTPQNGGTVRVATKGALPGNGITLKPNEWERWFRK